MTNVLVAEFADSRRLVAAARHALSSHWRVVETYTPYPVEGIQGSAEPQASRIRPAMFGGGVLMAALAYGVEYYSAVVDYPYNSGGRPLDAWPAFMLVPFATGILLAAVCGFACFLWEGELPRLSNPLFGVDQFGRASQDRFLLAVEVPREADDRTAACDTLIRLGAISLREIAP